jgi:uncharacterized membrane protein
MAILNLQKKYLPISIIIILAAILRLLIIFKYGNLWSDEWFSITYSQKPWWDSLTKFWIWETNPPLHMVFLKLWFYIFPITEFWARISSVTISLASIICLYKLNKKIFNEPIALVSAAIFSLISIDLFFAATVRTYSLLLLLTIIVSNYFFEIFYYEQKSKRNVLLFILFTTLLLYTHLTATLVLGSQFIALIITKRHYIKQWIFYMLPAGLIWLIWAIPSLNYKLNLNTVQKGWFFNITSSFLDLVNRLASLFAGYVSWKISIVILCLFCCGIYLVIRKQKQQAPINFVVIGILFLFPLLCVLFFSLLNIKFFLIVLPWSITLTAYMLHTLNKKYLFHIVIFAFLLFSTVNFYRLLPINDWRPVNDYISQKYNPTRKQIIIFNSFSQKYEVDNYLTAPIPAIAYIPLGADWDNFLITNNYLRYIHPETEIQAWLLDYKIDTAEEIILLDDKNVGVDIGSALLHSGWQEIGSQTKTSLAATVYLRYFKK